MGKSFGPACKAQDAPSELENGSPPGMSEMRDADSARSGRGRPGSGGLRGPDARARTAPADAPGGGGRGRWPRRRRPIAFPTASRRLESSKAGTPARYGRSTAAGPERQTSLPMPSVPSPLLPQHQREPWLVSAQTELLPQTTSVASDTPTTFPGRGRAACEASSPSSPAELEPQQLTLPSA
jgi:hypothetical protein